MVWVCGALYETGAAAYEADGAYEPYEPCEAGPAPYDGLELPKLIDFEKKSPGLADATASVQKTATICEPKARFY